MAKGSKFEITDEDKTDIANRRKQSNIIHSGFSFLRQQGGLNKGLIHTLLAPKGSGKSTMIRSIVLDYLRSNPTKNIFLYLSEESVLSLKKSLLPYADQLFAKGQSRLFVLSEQDEDDEFCFADFEEVLEEMVLTNDCEVVLFDNITSSKFYADKSVENQGRFCSGFKRATSQYDIATILVAHTGKKVSRDALITGDDIRGSSFLPIISEFMYISQMIRIGNIKVQTMQIEKHRPCNIANTFFSFAYDEHEMIYTHDSPVPFQWFKEKFKQRNKL